MTLPIVDLAVLSRDAAPLPTDLERALQDQQGVSLVAHRIVGAPQATDANRWQTIARARNVGKSVGRSPWVMFIDDDVLPDLNCVRRLLAGLEARPSYGALAADYLGEAAAGNARGHVGMGATLFRRNALARVQFRWTSDRCECQCCCDDLRAMGFGVGYLPGARAQHRKRPGPSARPDHEPGPHRAPAAPHVLVAFDRGHYDRFRRQFLGSLRASGNGEFVVAVAYGLYPSELRVLESQPRVEVRALPAGGVMPPVRRLADFQAAVAHLPGESPVAYWDAGDVVFQGSLAPLWREVASHPERLLAVREPQRHPRNRAVAAWTLTIHDATARRRAFELLSTRPFLNSGFAAGTAATLLRYFREAERLMGGRELAGSADWGDQTALNLYCHSNPDGWREIDQRWNYCLHARPQGEVVVGPGGRLVCRNGSAPQVVHGNAQSIARVMMSPYLL